MKGEIRLSDKTAHHTINIKKPKTMKKLLSLVIGLLITTGLTAQSTIQLPQPNIGQLKMSVGEALRTRRSYREYKKDKAIDLATLSTILWAACGISDPATGKITAPSAVNMQDIKIYVCSEKGVCLYDPKANALQVVSESSIIDALVGGQQFVRNAPYTLLLVSDQSQARRKNVHYGDMDAGYVSENIYLACTALGMRTVARAMMDKDAVRAALQLPEDVSVELNHPIGY